LQLQNQLASLEDIDTQKIGMSYKNITEHKKIDAMVVTRLNNNNDDVDIELVIV
jgi:hypothetical protein